MYGPTQTTISEYTTIRRVRRLPTPGEVLVQVGDQVEPDDVIARCSRHTETRLIDVAKSLSVFDREADQYLQKTVGDAVQKGDTIAIRKGAAGVLGTKVCRAPIDGTVVAINRGRVLLRSVPLEAQEQPDIFNLRALFRGTIVEIHERYGAVIEAQAALIEGLWGGGTETFGILRMMVESPDEPLTVASIDVDSQGYILVGGESIDQAALLRAAEVKVKGIIVGSIHARLIELEAKLPFPIIVTEGFGQIPMSAVIFDLLQSCDGEVACLSGSPHVRRAGERPEIVIFAAARGQAVATSKSTTLHAGVAVRITREPYIGKVGTIKSLPNKPWTTESGIALPSAEVEINGMENVVVPIANLERI